MLNEAAFSAIASGCVVAQAFSDLADSPFSLIAVTVKQYSVFAVKPVTVYDVSVTVAITIVSL